MAGVHAARHSGSTGGRRASTSRRFHRQRISCALGKGLAFELRHGMRVLRARGVAPQGWDNTRKIGSYRV
eukprot:626559-Prymnesium_polylepis.1